ncbi:hypothetical protein [Bradyrhizobium elkanii]|uniref:hypothetical protein n=1 Tax=Bradyrhizobium elkanii TaxID=29448 RepID=UPI001BAE25A5|nr:hypothetical protein [Bradyrhizobium elkanii]MBR1163865.1 hypothetical protein [Bradyrhizobium elkanii]
MPVTIIMARMVQNVPLWCASTMIARTPVSHETRAGFEVDALPAPARFLAVIGNREAGQKQTPPDIRYRIAPLRWVAQTLGVDRRVNIRT